MTTIPCQTWLSHQESRIKQFQDLFDVAADKTKLQIILLLDQYNKHSDEHDETLYVTDLADHIGVSVSAISHQLKHLEQKGFVTRTKAGQSAIYRLTTHSDMLLECYKKLTK